MQAAMTEVPGQSRRRRPRAGLGSALVAAGLLASAAPALAVPIIGVVNSGTTGPNTLAQFDSSTPGTFTSTLTVTGLGTQTIRNIDFRPATGQLYAVGNNGGLFTINTTTGVATTIGSIGINPGDLDFGMAFNPLPDRIRVVTGATDKNLRVNPDTAGVMTDTPLAYAAGDVNAGVNPTVTSVAYTNQRAPVPSETQLYGIDVGTDTLVRIDNPNSGILTTVGGLLLDVLDPSPGQDVGFDIDGAPGGLAYASLLRSDGSVGFYTIDLASGAASFVDDFNGANVLNITVGSLGGTAVPEPASLAVLGVGLLGLAAVRRRRRAQG